MNLLLVLAGLLLGLAHAVMMPRNMPDGVYAFQRHKNETAGRTAHPLARRKNKFKHLGFIKQGLSFEPNPYNGTERTHLPLPGINRKKDVLCGKDRHLNVTDYVRAKEMLKDFCEKYPISKMSIHAAVAGDVIVFACSEGDRKPCSGLEIDAAEDLIDDKCGDDVAGQVHIARWSKKYGREGPDTEFCNWAGYFEEWSYRLRPLPVWVEGRMREDWLNGEEIHKQDGSWEGHRAGPLGSGATAESATGTNRNETKNPAAATRGAKVTVSSVTGATGAANSLSGPTFTAHHPTKLTPGNSQHIKNHTSSIESSQNRSIAVGFAKNESMTRAAWPWSDNKTASAESSNGVADIGWTRSNETPIQGTFTSSAGKIVTSTEATTEHGVSTKQTAAPAAQTHGQVAVDATVAQGSKPKLHDKQGEDKPREKPSGTSGADNEAKLVFGEPVYIDGHRYEVVKEGGKAKVLVSLGEDDSSLDVVRVSN